MHPSRISLSFLFIVALIGTLLRSYAYFPLPLEYTHLVHAHSHVAFQGWVYTLMILLLTNLYLSDGQIQEGRYRLQFNLTTLVIIGVLISFSLQGYALFSILFSTLFQFLNYWFIYRFFKDTRAIESTPSIRFIKTGLWLGIISTVVPFAIGILSAKGLNDSEAYHSLIYTFLHLQYNGWFLFVVLGLLFKYIENKDIHFRKELVIKFYWCFTLAVLPAISLSLLGMSYSKWLMPFAYLSASLQIAGVVFFVLSLSKSLTISLRSQSAWFRVYLLVFAALFCVKVLLQGLSVVPALEPYAFHNKLIILSYLHLSLIGVISFILLAMMIDQQWIIINRTSKIGNILLVVGFFATEAVLALGGFGIFYSQLILIAGSVCMALGILFLAIHRPV